MHCHTLAATRQPTINHPNQHQFLSSTESIGFFDYLPFAANDTPCRQYFDLQRIAFTSDWTFFNIYQSATQRGARAHNASNAICTIITIERSFGRMRKVIGYHKRGGAFNCNRIAQQHYGNTWIAGATRIMIFRYLNAQAMASSISHSLHSFGGGRSR